MSLMQIAATVRDRRSDSPWLQVLMPVVAVGGASLMALLVAEGFWPVALMLLLALPGFVLLHRYPFAVLMIWLLLAPFLVATGGGILRYVYWIIHRALPPAAIMIVVLSAALRIHPRRLPRPSVADAAALAYVAASLLSILYLSEQVSTTAIYLYDHVFIPVCLYLLVRLVRPQERDLRLLLPVVIFTLVTQSIIGLLSWSAPQLLPGAWLGRAGLRTTGSLDSYSVFTATVAFCGLYLFEYAESLQSNRKARYALVFLFLLSGFMIFFSFSRGSWLAGLIIMAGLFLSHRRSMIQLSLITIPILVLVLGSGLLADEVAFAQQRFFSADSEESALSRLPVVYASVRMFEEKPLFGWGYENFDKFDYRFQRRVGDLITPDKDHASHNVYLTILAEQGLAGLVLFLTPLVWALIATARAWPRMRTAGFYSRKLIFSLWLVLVFHIVVNNFSNMRIEYGQGMWWIALALIATLAGDESMTARGQDA